jgi:hypothetical protein
MGDISKIEQGALARSSKVNEIIGPVNALKNMTVRLAEGEEEPGLNVSDNNAELVVPSGGGDGGGGAGLPEFPGEEPSLEIKAPLIWDAENEEGRWLQGDTDVFDEDVPKVGVLAHNPDPDVDTFSILYYESLSGIVCENGAPIAGKILFERDEA